MPKSVGVIGAGPSGLTAAKTLIHDSPVGQFKVTIFDAQTRIGGLWPSSKEDAGGLVHPLMQANQSRHTVSFSDLAWEEDAPEFPKAWQFGRYLERYRQRYLFGVDFHLGTHVESAEPSGSWPNAKWHVRVSSDAGTEEYEFDYLVIAAGYHGKEIVPPGLVSGKAQVPILHSSKYRNLEQLLSGSNGEGGKILVVGGQLSGVEIAATIATHLSTATNAPTPSGIPNVDKYTVHNITQRPTWILPFFTSPKPASAAPPFLPIDWNFYNLAARPKPLTNTQGHITPEAAAMWNGIFMGVVGGDQSAFAPTVAVQGDALKQTPYMGLTDNYLDFVRSGLITVSHGKLASVDGRSAAIVPSGEEIANVAAVVLATGFDASNSLSYLPAALREKLALRPGDLEESVALAFHGTYHPDLPNLGFVGFYRSPYWGVIEMQSRFVAALFEHGGPNSPSLPPSIKEALAHDDSAERILKNREDKVHRAQFPMGDYPWLMQEIAKALDQKILPPPGQTPPLPPANQSMDILTPARYPPKNLTEDRAREGQESLRQAYQGAVAALTKGKFLARAVFRSLLGEWKLERDLTSKLPSHPTGHFSGTARFLLREGTGDGRESWFEGLGGTGDPGLEYLYIEEGVFTAVNGGPSFPATRRYIWRYDEGADRLSVWFVKTDDPKKADYLFHEIEFVVPEEDRDEAKGWEAHAGHLCIQDFYNVRYEFLFRAINLHEFRLGYQVHGPNKDYSIDGTYRR